MSVLLPAGLPAGFTLEPATGDHAAEVFVLVAAEQTAAFGFCPDTEEDVRSMLEQPATTTSMELPGPGRGRDTGAVVGGVPRPG